MPNRLTEEEEEERYLGDGARMVADRILRAYADGPRRPGPQADSLEAQSQRNQELADLQAAIVGTQRDPVVPSVDRAVLAGIGRGTVPVTSIPHELAFIGSGKINEFLTSREQARLSMPQPGGSRRPRTTRRRKSRRGRKRARLNKRRPRKTRGVSKIRRTRYRGRRSRRT